jgi:xylulokinase
MTTLGIDLGTGSVKAAILDDDLQVLAKASRPNRVNAPHAGWAESDPEQWLTATRDAITEVTAAHGAPDTAGFSGQMHGVVVVDEHFAPLRPAILWADVRSVERAQRLRHDMGASLSRIGSPAVAGFAATTLAWLKDHEPDVMARAAYALQPKDWLRVALGGDLATDPSDASGTLLYDVADGRWSAPMIDWLGIDQRLLPPVLASNGAAGEIRIDGDFVRCVVGGADTACALAGLGLRTGGGFVAVGSGAQVVRVMARPELDETLRTHTFATAGPIGDGWYRIGAVQSAGLTLTPALTWLGASVAEASAALVGGVDGGDPVFVPYLSGERTPFMDPELRGAWYGLSLATDRAAMLRSILEGVAQAVALGVDAVQSSGDPLPDVVPLIGGGTHDPAFQQLLADATGLTLAITDAPDSAVVGAGLLALGLTGNPQPVGSVTLVSPRPESAQLLRERREMMKAHVLAEEQS